MHRSYNERRTRKRHQSSRVEERRRYVLEALERPRTQAELRDALGMSNSGILNLMRHLERDGLVRAAERVARTRIWEKASNGMRSSQ